MPRCSVPGCDNESKSPECSELSWFTYPIGNEQLLRQWLARIRRVDFQPNRYSRICSVHFSEDSFQENFSLFSSFVESGETCEPTRKRRRRKILKDGSIPSVFPGRSVASRAESSVQRASCRKSSYVEKKEHREVTRKVSICALLALVLYVSPFHIHLDSSMSSHCSRLWKEIWTSITSMKL